MKTEIAKALLDIEAIFLRPSEPFIWASGIKSPIYCDNRLSLSHPFTRNLIKEKLAHNIITYFPDCEYIMGTATAGIAHAALVADLLKLPMGYVRSSSKGHGRENKVEGKVEVGAKVVVVEDLISTGGSCIEVVNTLQEAKFKVLGVVAIFSYELPQALKAFKDINLRYFYLSDYDSLVETAVVENYIRSEDVEKLKQWKSNPFDDSWMF